MPLGHSRQRPDRAQELARHSQRRKLHARRGGEPRRRAGRGLRPRVPGRRAVRRGAGRPRRLRPPLGPRRHRRGLRSAAHRRAQAVGDTRRRGRQARAMREALWDRRRAGGGDDRGLPAQPRAVHGWRHVRAQPPLRAPARGAGRRRHRGPDPKDCEPLHLRPSGGRAREQHPHPQRLRAAWLPRRRGLVQHPSDAVADGLQNAQGRFRANAERVGTERQSRAGAHGSVGGNVLRRRRVVELLLFVPHREPAVGDHRR